MATLKPEEVVHLVPLMKTTMRHLAHFCHFLLMLTPIVRLCYAETFKVNSSQFEHKIGLAVLGITCA